MCDCSSHNGFLTAKGLAEAAQRKGALSETIDMFEDLCYLDKVGSVSALAEAEGSWPSDEQLENQYQRFLNGW